MIGSALAVIGLLVVVAGTFLPWLTSGGVDRSSYAVLGIVRRLRFVDGGPAAIAISLWPLLGTIAMVPVVAGILRWWRTAATATLVFGVLTGVGAALVLAVAGGHGAAGISVNLTGPTVTVIGAGIAVMGALVILVVLRRSRRHLVPTNSHRDVSAELPDGPVRRTAQSSSPIGSDGAPASWPHSPPHTADRRSVVETERENAG